MATFFSWLSQGLSKILSFLVSLPGLILTVVTTLVGAVTSVFSILSDLTIDADSFVEGFSRLGANSFWRLIDNEWYSVLSYSLNLKELFGYTVNLLTLSASLFFLFATVAFGAFLLLFVQCYTIKIISKAVSLVCPVLRV